MPVLNDKTLQITTPSDRAVGMIRAFEQLQAAGDAVDATTLSGGIAQALLTTAAGLAIAIPAIAAHTSSGVASTVNSSRTSNGCVMTAAPLLAGRRLR